MDDMISVVRCKKCSECNRVNDIVQCEECIDWYDRDEVCMKIYSDGALSQHAYQHRKPNDFCSYGRRIKEDSVDIPPKPPARIYAEDNE